jgi:hypothetical protein
MTMDDISDFLGRWFFKWLKIKAVNLSLV